MVVVSEIIIGIPFNVIVLSPVETPCIGPSMAAEAWPGAMASTVILFAFHVDPSRIRSTFTVTPISAGTISVYSFKIIPFSPSTAVY